MTAAIKVSKIAQSGQQFLLVEYGVDGWVNLDTGGLDTLDVDVSLAAITLAPDSEMDQCLVAYPDFILGPTGNPPQQTVRIGAGAPLLGRVPAQPAVTNGTINITPYITIQTFKTYFELAGLGSNSPKLRLHLWLQEPPKATVPSPRTQWANFAPVTLDATEQSVFRAGSWGRSVVDVVVTGTNTSTVRVYGVMLNQGTAVTTRTLLASGVTASNIIEVGPIVNHLYDVIEVTVQGVAAAGSNIVRLRMRD